ncbi:ribonuclease E inhibitor RraB [Sphingobium sp. Z007]|uniref:ribonuclease E inhibitor RraB n=1 Tax=Sphingobium sp. Z007 TaxID=627495 RepID=UPI000B4A1067|nr:ribonuclease E inhibitor RraB [Sphingobium sp. Z007]
MSINLPPVDEARLAAEWEADREVLANLAANGDVARIARPVDVSFRGSEKDFDRLLTIASQFGMVELDREEDDEGDLFLFLECVQPVDEASIRALTRKCLQIEILCGVEYDGWGCEAQTGAVH